MIVVAEQRDRLADHRQQILRSMRGFGGNRAVAHHHHKLVAAEAGDRGALGQCTGNAPGNLLQQRVAALMTQRIVNQLEAVKVDEQHRHRLAGIGRFHQRPLQQLRKQQPVRQPRQFVVMRQLTDALLRVCALGDIAHDPGELGAAINAHGAQRQFYRKQRTIPAQRLELVPGTG